MKIETRPTTKDYYICEHCGEEYERESEAEFCEVECVRLKIRLNCKHEFFYTIDLGNDEIEVSKKCSCGFIESCSIDLEKISDEEENKLAEPLFSVVEASLLAKNNITNKTNMEEIITHEQVIEMANKIEASIYNIKTT